MMVAFLGLPIIGSSTVYAAGSCDRAFLTFPTWYRGLTDGDCNLMDPSQFNRNPTTGAIDVANGNGGLSAFIWHIVLNIIEIALQAVVYITVIFILYGGFQYITSAGSADAVKSAKSTITNAAIGLVVALSATAIVNLIVGIWK